MRTTDAVVLGAGHCGLAMSGCLAERSIDHVVLERREIANSWKTERWDALRLLTPNWQCRLPGYAYSGDDPDGFMTMPEVADFITRYAQEVSAPVHAGTTVTAVRAVDGGYHVVTDQGDWRCTTVVIATGAFNVPRLPDYAVAVPSTVATLTPMQYRNPGQLADGGVLVVGASASGVQIAHEIRGSGRPVTLAVGEHVRGPRVYRDRDIHWWMDASGVLDERYDEVDDIVRRAACLRCNWPVLLRDRPSISTRSPTSVCRSSVGSRRSGTVARSSRARCATSARSPTSSSEDFSTHSTSGRPIPASTTPCHRRTGSHPRGFRTRPLELDLASGEIRTIIWATGYRPDYSWLDVPVLDRKGLIRHDGGVVGTPPGMYLIGAPFLRRRKSSFIDGGRADAEDLVGELAAYLDGQASAGPSS